MILRLIIFFCTNKLIYYGLVCGGFQMADGILRFAPYLMRLGVLSAHLNVMRVTIARERVCSHVSNTVLLSTVYGITRMHHGVCQAVGLSLQLQVRLSLLNLPIRSN